jgi:Copper type II ascorbate-dependent monooxygenase, C-terminal domain
MIMNRTLFFIALTALTTLAAVFFLGPSSSAGGLAKSKAAVTFNKDVAPILFKSCAECHRPGEAAPMSLLSYKDARPWARSIREKVVSREMPPWHADPHVGQFSNDPRLTRGEIDTITAWVDGGAKEGEPRDLPPAPKFVEGWSIGQPDLILKMPEEFTLDANGPDEYQHFVIDPGFTEDKYVQIAEARPGNRRIVHHIIAAILPPTRDGQPQKQPTKEEFEKMRAERDPILYSEGFLRRLRPEAPVYDDGCQLPNGGGGNQLDGSGQFRFGMLLCGFAPGREPTNWGPGTVKKIPAGSKILLQVHYSKTAGQVEKDHSMIGLVFAKQPPRKELFTCPIQNRYFRIPAGAENHRVTACWTAQEDIHLTGARPHMHKRGKAMEIKVFYPNGRSEVLLNVPRYDFSWQTLYNFKQPVAIPKGTRFQVTGYLDNSTKNKHNPDPTRVVRFGEPTYDEMMIGWIEYTVDSQSLKPADSVSMKGATQK